MARPKLILIVGLGHSGTTILDMALGVSSKVRGIGEALRMCGQFSNPGVVGEMVNGRGDSLICSCGSSVNECCFWSSFKEDTWIDVNLHDTFGSLVRKASALQEDDCFVLDSSPSGWKYLDQLKEYDVRIIHITRDVRSWSYSQRSRKKTGILKSWTCRGLVLVPVLACYAAFCSKVTGLLYPSAEWRRRGL